MGGKNMKAIILCGGLGTRFLPVTKGISKELLPIFDKPILQYLVDDLIANNVTEIAFIIRPDKTDIVKYFTKNAGYESAVDDATREKLTNYNKARFYFIAQNTPKGTADALNSAKTWVEDDMFFVLNGDEVIQNTPSLISQMLAKYHQVQAPVLALKQVSAIESKKYGMVKIDHTHSGQIKGIVEKPQSCPPSMYASLGAYLLEPSVFEYIRLSDDMPLTDAIDLYVQNNFLYGVEIQGHRYDLGNPLGYVLSNFEYVLFDPSTQKITEEKLNSLGFEKRK